MDQLWHLLVSYFVCSFSYILFCVILEYLRSCEYLDRPRNFKIILFRISFLLASKVVFGLKAETETMTNTHSVRRVGIQKS